MFANWQKKKNQFMMFAVRVLSLPGRAETGSGGWRRGRDDTVGAS